MDDVEGEEKVDVAESVEVVEGAGAERQVVEPGGGRPLVGRVDRVLGSGIFSNGNSGADYFCYSLS